MNSNSIDASSRINIDTLKGVRLIKNELSFDSLVNEKEADKMNKKQDLSNNVAMSKANFDTEVNKKEENTMKSIAMKRAWEIALAEADINGGSSKDYLSEAVKQAWKEIKGGDAAEGANVVVENKEVEEMEFISEALVVKNKVEKEDVFFLVNGTQKVVSEYQDGATPIVKLSPKMWQVQMASLQDFNNPKYLSDKEVQVILPYVVENVESSYAKTLLKREVPIIDGREGIMIDLGGVSAPSIYLTFKELEDGTILNKADMFCLQAGFAGPGHRRIGAHGVLNAKASHYEYVSNLGLELESFVKETAEGLKLSLKKIGTRVLLSGSSVTRIPLFKGFEWLRTEFDTIDYMGEPVEVTVYVLTNGEEEIKLAIMPEDFTVVMQQDLYGPTFEGDKVEFGMFEAKLNKVATDGTVYFDPKLAKRGGLEKSFTFRFAQLAKGLGQIVPETKEKTGYDAIFFGGAVKADISPYIERNQLDFGVIMHARDKDSDLLNLSRQAAKRALTSEVYTHYQELTREIVEGVKRLDMEFVTKFLSIGKGLDEEELGEMDEDDLQVTHLYHENPAAFLQEVSLRNRLRSFLKKQLDKYVNGERIIIDNAVWRHMVSDPYTVLQYISRGKLSVNVEELKEGIRGDQSLTVVNGKIDTRTVVLYRFPFLHKYEARKLNVSGNTFDDKVSHDYYKKYAEYFVGMQVYSLRDMQAEGQSGADFDGDTTIVVFNDLIVEATEEYPYFLDYSLVDGEVIEGAPFEDEKPVKWDFFTSKELNTLNELGIELCDNGDIVFPQLTEELEELAWKAVANISMQGLEPGFVGLLSNASDTVVEYATTVEEASADYEKLDRYNSFLTVGVRWEIDKAKHGGSFYNELPFLGAIVNNNSDMASLEDMEKEYDLILTPFFAEGKNKIATFRISYTMYYGKEASEKALWIDSEEHRNVLENIRVMNEIEEVVAAENSHQFHLVSYAKEMLVKGMKLGYITPKMIDIFDWDFVAKHNISLDHPIKLIQTMSARRRALEDSKLNEFLSEEDIMVIDTQLKDLRKEYFAITSKMKFKIPGEYIFALVYLSIARKQYRLGRKSSNFKMSYIPGLFSYFAKEAHLFLGAINELSPTATVSDEETSFLIIGIEEKDVSPVFSVIHGRTSDGGYVNLQDDLYKTLMGIFKVTYVKQANNGVVVRGHFVSPDTFNPQSNKKGVVLEGPSAINQINSSIDSYPSDSLSSYEEIDTTVHKDVDRGKRLPTRDLNMNTTKELETMNKLVNVLRTRIGCKVGIKVLRDFLKEKTNFSEESSILIDGVWHRAFRYETGSVLYFQFVKTNELAYVGLARLDVYDHIVNKKAEMAEDKEIDRQYAIIAGGD